MTTLTATRIEFRCATCGSANVRVDAYAYWDVRNQCWELGPTFDNSICEDCGGECSLEEIEVEGDGIVRHSSDCQVRHDINGFYLCTDQEATYEDDGHASVGFDGRPHYTTFRAALEAEEIKAA